MNLNRISHCGGMRQIHFSKGGRQHGFLRQLLWIDFSLTWANIIDFNLKWSGKGWVQRTNLSFKVNNRRVPTIRIWLMYSCYFEQVLIYKFTTVVLNFKKGCHYIEVHEQNRRWKAVLWPVLHQEGPVWRTDTLLGLGLLAALHWKLNCFGSCMGRGQELIGSALGACFCLFLNAFSLKGESTWLSCVCQWGLIWARNVLLSSVCPEASQFRREGADTSPPSPVHPFPRLPLPHAGRGICVGKQCGGWKVHGHMDHSVIKKYSKEFTLFLLFLLCWRMLYTAISCCFHVKSNKLFIYLQGEISISFTSVILYFF